MEQGLAGGLAFVSLALPTGWYWFKKGQSKTQSWQNLEQRWLGRTAEFFYFVGLPYLALLFGLLTPKLLGLKGLEHFALISTSNLSMVSLLAVGAQKAITLMLVESLVDSGVMIGAGLIGLIILGGITLGLARYGISVGTFQTSVVDTIYYCLHWAFYRAIFWSMTGDLYLGVVLGGGLVMLEGGVIIWLQQGWPAQLSSPFLMEVIVLILTSVIFFYCPNLWLLWPIHLAMVVLIKNKSLLKEVK